MEREDFRRYWDRLRVQWPPYPKENDEAKFSIYYKRLRRYRVEAVERAVGAWFDIGKKFPMISDITDRIGADGHETIPGSRMEEMNAQIRAKQVADRKNYKVIWLADETGAIAGYRLEDGREAYERATRKED